VHKFVRVFKDKVAAKKNAVLKSVHNLPLLMRVDDSNISKLVGNQVSIYNAQDKCSTRNHNIKNLYE